MDCARRGTERRDVSARESAETWRFHFLYGWMYRILYVIGEQHDWTNARFLAKKCGQIFAL